MCSRPRTAATTRLSLLVGFFTPGKDSIVVPIRSLKVSPERDSFFLPLPEAAVRTVLVMPDQDYNWLSDEIWCTRNDALFARP